MKNIDECSQKTESFNVIKVINKNSNCFNPVIGKNYFVNTPRGFNYIYCIRSLLLLNFNK